MRIDDIDFFEALADAMNNDPGRFTAIGEAYMDCILVMDPQSSEPGQASGGFAVRVLFDGVRCEHVLPADADEPADFHLVGSVDAWRAMFDDIARHGGATGLQTINSLALLGGAIECVGNDPMGLDKFSRFNQTLQEFFDGAARLGATTGGRS